MNFREPRIYLPRWTKAARGQPCVGCHGMICNPETTVAAHIKIPGLTNHGAGAKPDDMFIAFLGSKCHADLDSSRKWKEEKQRLNLVRKTWRALYELGVLR